MAGAETHRPKLYYCDSCRVVFAGYHNPEAGESEEHYTPPDSCDVCGHGEFVELTGR